MATLSTHVLDALQGAHAAGLQVTLLHVHESGRRDVLLREVTDNGGRLRADVTVAEEDTGMTCELVLQLSTYFARAGNMKLGDMKTLQEAVVRFVMTDPQGAYHIPLIIAPHSYTVWCGG